MVGVVSVSALGGKKMYVGDKRGTPLVSVVRVSEGPLLGGSLSIKLSLSVVRRLSASRRVR